MFSPFEIEVVDIFNDDIAAWQFGNIDYIDNIKPLQDGFRTRYPLYYQNQLVSFEIDNNDADSKEIDLGPVLLVFINGVIQDPDVHYVFKGGTSIQFTTPPSTGDDVFIFFFTITIKNTTIHHSATTTTTHYGLDYSKPSLSKMCNAIEAKLN